MPEDALNKVKDIISHSFNWEEVLETAIWHGIVPLLYNNLKNIREDHLIPREIMDRLRTAYHENLARNMYLYAELRGILEALREKDVEVILLKGAALAKTVYGDIGLRPMGDIDLLVKKEALPYAEKTMHESGYHFHGDMSPEWYREVHHHISYVHPDKNILVEIHWHIAQESHPSRIRVMENEIIENWWEGAQAIEFSGNKAHILCPHDLIMHLSLHFLKHRFNDIIGVFSSKGALIQLCDIFQTLKYYKDEIDWIRLKSEAKKYGIESLIYTTLFIVREIMGEHDDVFHNAFRGFRSEDFDKELVRLIKRRILIRDDDRTRIPTTLIQSQIAHTFQEKLKILRRGIFPNPEVISKKYSLPLTSKMLYFYYVIYPFYLLLKYGKILLKISRMKEEAILNAWIHAHDPMSRKP